MADFGVASFLSAVKSIESGIGVDGFWGDGDGAAGELGVEFSTGCTTGVIGGFFTSAFGGLAGFF